MGFNWGYHIHILANAIIESLCDGAKFFFLKAILTFLVCKGKDSGGYHRGQQHKGRDYNHVTCRCQFRGAAGPVLQQGHQLKGPGDKRRHRRTETDLCGFRDRAVRVILFIVDRACERLVGYRAGLGERHVHVAEDGHDFRRRKRG